MQRFIAFDDVIIDTSECCQVVPLNLPRIAIAPESTYLALAYFAYFP